MLMKVFVKLIQKIIKLDFWFKICKKNYLGLIGLGFYKKYNLKNKVLLLLIFKWINYLL